MTIDALDPIFYDEKDDKWYFWDEVWADTIGPYDTREQAVEAIERYVKEELT